MMERSSLRTIAGETTTVCQHQDRLIAEALDDAATLGQFLGLTEASRVAIDAFTMASIDATPEQWGQWARDYVRFLFWSEGTRCAECGHVATGPLTECSTEDVKRWSAGAR